MTLDATLGRARIEIVADRAELQRGLQDARRETDTAARGMSRSFQGVATQASGLTGALDGVAAAGGRIATRFQGGISALRSFAGGAGQMLATFGLLGAAMGAAEFALQAALRAIWEHVGATESLADAQKALESSTDRVVSLNREIEKSSGAVRDALLEERDANIALLEARNALAKETLANRQSQLERRALLDLQAGNFGDEVAEGLGSVLGADQFGAGAIEDRISRILEKSPEARIELAGLRRAIAVADAELNKLETGDTGEGRSRRGRGPGGSRRDATDRFSDEAAKIADRIAALNDDRAAVHLSGEALIRYTALLEAAKVERSLLAAAERDGTAATLAQREAAATLADSFRAASEAAALEKFHLDENRRSKEANKRAADELAEGIADMAKGLASAIAGADSFGDALLRLAPKLADLIIDATILQRGPLAGVLGGLLGSIFGAATSFAVGGGASRLSVTQPPVTGLSFAAGGLPPIGQVVQVGERGPELAVFGSAARVLSADQTADALGGGGGTLVNAPISLAIDASGAVEGTDIRIAAAVQELLTQLPDLIRSHAAAGRV